MIQSAAERQKRRIRSFQVGSHLEECQRLLIHIASAESCLLDPEQKAAYDSQLNPRAAPSRAQPQRADGARDDAEYRLAPEHDDGPIPHVPPNERTPHLPYPPHEITSSGSSHGPLGSSAAIPSQSTYRGARPGAGSGVALRKALGIVGGGAVGIVLGLLILYAIGIDPREF
ncbi:MAG: hypothetical protein KY475_23245, partial [Planctomycetes bacterium]|nr:hypothetical protein [Planctomycetota bacterium]